MSDNINTAGIEDVWYGAVSKLINRGILTQDQVDSTEVDNESKSLAFWEGISESTWDKITEDILASVAINYDVELEEY